jgi:transcriptional regulator with XRE-family HTH domain
MDVKKTRKALGLTQAELAAELGLDNSTIFRMEKDGLKVCRRTQLALEALLTRAGITPKIDGNPLRYIPVDLGE